MTIEEIRAKAKKAKEHLPATIGQNENGDIVITIPQRIPQTAVHSSSSDKSMLVTVQPMGNGKAAFPVVVYGAPDAEGNCPEEVFSLRLGFINATVVA